MLIDAMMDRAPARARIGKRGSNESMHLYVLPSHRPACLGTSILTQQCLACSKITVRPGKLDHRSHLQAGLHYRSRPSHFESTAMAAEVAEDEGMAAMEEDVGVEVEAEAGVAPMVARTR